MKSWHLYPMPLIWTPVHSTAKWTAPPAAPRVVRAAIAGQGWLVSTEVSGGWSTTFVPDPGATDPPDESVEGGFQAAKVGWDAPETTHVLGTDPSVQETKQAPVSRKKGAAKSSR